MPEEVQSTDQQTTPKETSKNILLRINWFHIVIGVIAGVILLGMGFGVYLLTQSKPVTTGEPIKVSTPSAKQTTPSAKATPSADKDETTNWKVVKSTSTKVQFSVPQNWVIKETDGVDTSEGVINISITASDPLAEEQGKKTIFSIVRNPVTGLSLDKTREEKITIGTIEAIKVYFQDRPDFPGAKKGEHTWIITPFPLEVKNEKYDISGQWTVGETESLNTLNKVLKTLNFLD